jgi:clan AA aspartic protease
VAFRLANQPDVKIEFVVDTGFEGFLTLPPPAVAALGLPYLHDLSAKLADDNSIRVDVRSATIVWDGEEYEVTVLALGQRPLLGTSLLDGNEACIQFTDGGLVTIDRL